MIRFLLILPFLMLSCTSPPPGVTSTQGDLIPLGKEAHPGVKLTAGSHRLQWGEAGAYQAFFGNPGDRAVELHLESQSFVLPAGSWSRISVPETSGDLELSVPEPVILGPVLYMGKSKTRLKNVLVISIDTLRADFFNEEHMPLTFSLFQEH